MHRKDYMRDYMRTRRAENNGKIKMHESMDIDPEHHQYLIASARIRGISVSRLLNRILTTVCRDQMILAVLDDDSKVCRQMPGEPNASRFKPRKEAVS